MPSINLLPGAEEEKEHDESKPPVRRVELSSPSKEAGDQAEGPGGLFSFFRRRPKAVPSLTEETAPKPEEESLIFSRGTGVSGQRTVLFTTPTPPKTYSALPEKKSERARGEIVEMRTVGRKKGEARNGFLRFFRPRPKPPVEPSVPPTVAKAAEPARPVSAPKPSLPWWKKAFRRPVTPPTPPAPSAQHPAPSNEYPVLSAERPALSALTTPPTPPSTFPPPPVTPRPTAGPIPTAPLPEAPSPAPVPPPAPTEFPTVRLDMNLMPTEFQEALAPKRKLLTLASVIVGAVLLVVGANVGLAAYRSNVTQKVALVDQEIDTIDHQIGTFQTFQAEALALKEKLDVIVGLLSRHVRWTSFLSHLEATTLSDVYFTSLTGDVGGKITLTAVAKDLSTLSTQLLVFQQDSSFVQDVSVTGARIVAGGTLPSTTTGALQPAVPPVAVSSHVEFTAYLTVKPDIFTTVDLAQLTR